jgi:hypothetical protein
MDISCPVDDSILDDNETEIRRCLNKALELFAQENGDFNFPDMCEDAAIGDLIHAIVLAYQKSTLSVQPTPDTSALEITEQHLETNGILREDANDNNVDKEPDDISSLNLSEDLAPTSSDVWRSGNDRGLNAEEILLSFSNLALKPVEANAGGDEADIDEWEDDDDNGFVSIRLTKQEFLQVERKRLSEIEHDFEIDNESVSSGPRKDTISEALLNATEAQCGANEYTPGFQGV